MLQTISDINKSEIDFMLCKKLIYYKKDNDFCLYVSAVLEKKIFKIIHDDNVHKKHDRVVQ